MTASSANAIVQPVAQLLPKNREMLQAPLAALIGLPWSAPMSYPFGNFEIARPKTAKGTCHVNAK
ncbi:hypothetical protein ABIB26_002604 [Arthrobacter sp. UYEF20]